MKVALNSYILFITPSILFLTKQDLNEASVMMSQNGTTTKKYCSKRTLYTVILSSAFVHCMEVKSLSRLTEACSTCTSTVCITVSLVARINLIPVVGTYIVSRKSDKLQQAIEKNSLIEKHPILGQGNNVSISV